jgi:hypothetical protein
MDPDAIRLSARNAWLHFRRTMQLFTRPPAPRHLPAEIAARRPLPPRTPPPSPHHRIAPYAEGHMLLAGDLCNGDNYANDRYTRRPRNFQKTIDNGRGPLRTLAVEMRDYRQLVRQRVTIFLSGII